MTEFEKTFEEAAADYEKSRPLYAKTLFEHIFRYKPIDSASKVLEIGIGTGKATLPFLETGCDLSAIEPGEQLAFYAARNYAAYDHFSLHRQTFQEFACPPESFDLIYSATAFHWIPQEYGYRRVYELLKKGGAFARFAYHAGADKERHALTAEIRSLYQAYMDESGGAREYGEEDASALAQLAETYGFVDTTYRLFGMTKGFTADAYMELLRTYSDHRKLEQTKRELLFNGIHRAIQKHGGVMTVHYTVDLQLARKPRSDKGETSCTAASTIN